MTRQVTAPVPTSGFLMVLGAAALFGTLGPLSRFAYDDGMEPAAFVAWRALIGAIGAAAFVAWRIRTGPSHLVRPGELPTRVRITLFVATSMGFFLNLLMFIAFDLVTVALALLCFYSYPAMVAAINVSLGRDRLDGSKVVALGLALVGMVAVVASQLDPSAGIRFVPLGVAFAIGAALCQTVFIVISRDGYSAVPSEQAMTLTLLVTVVGATLLAILGGRVETLAFPLQTPSVLPLLLFAGIFAAAIPSIAFLSGVRTVGGTRAGILMLFEPVVGVALAAWLLGERLMPIQLAGALAILAAAVILQRGTARGEAATEPWPVVG
jgi:drug/metabolite transporter (DMT)-like permease